MRVSKPGSMVLAGIALAALPHAQQQAAFQPVNQDQASNVEGSFGHGAIQPQGPLCATGGQVMGKWLQIVGKDDELQGFLYDASGSPIYEMKATMATFVYLSPGNVIFGMGGLYGFLYDASLDPTDQVPLAQVFGTWTKTGSDTGKFQALVLSPNGTQISQGAAIGEIRGQYGPSSLYQTPDIATDPPAPNSVNPAQPPAVRYGDDVLIKYYDKLGASSQSKAGKHSFTDFQSIHDHTPIDVVPGHRPQVPAPSSANGLPVASGLSIVSGSAQEVRPRNQAGFSLAVKEVPDGIGQGVVPEDPVLTPSKQGGAVSKAGDHSSAALVGGGDSPAGLSWSAHRQRANRGLAGAAGKRTGAPGPSGDKGGAGSAGGPTGFGDWPNFMKVKVQKQSDRDPASLAGVPSSGQPGPHLVPIQPPGSSPANVSGQASGSSTQGSAIGFTNYSEGGFVGTWMICF